MRSVSSLLLLPGVALLALSACKKDLPMPASTPPKIVLIGELVAGDSMQLRAGRSQSFAEPRTIATPEREMRITCSAPAGERVLTGYEDDLLYTLYTTRFSNPGLVQEQTEYRIKAEAPGLAAVDVPVHVPAAFSADVTASGTVRFAGESMREFGVTMSALPAGTKYVVEVLRSPVAITTSFEFDGRRYVLEQEPRLYDSLIRAGERVDLLRDTSYSSSQTRQPFYSDRSSDENTAPGASRAYNWFFINLDGAASSFRLYIPIATNGAHWQYHIRLKSVAADYYEFLKGYELGNLQPYDNDDDDRTLKPSSGSGNVRGGIGIIGGVYLQERRFVY